MSRSTFGIELKQLKNGDFIFQNLDCGPMCTAIESVTEGYQGQDFSHVGIVYFKNDSAFVIESAGEGVRLKSLSAFLSSTKHPHLVGRLKGRYQHLISPALGFMLLRLGMPYDPYFVMNNGKYYCSELIYDAFTDANQGKPIFKLYPMTYKSPGSHYFFPVWEQHFSELKAEVPEGLPGCNPGGMSLSKRLSILGYLDLEDE